jgi:hypothetical protein
MSFSFNAAGKPHEARAVLRDQAEFLDQLPDKFAEAADEQLASLPENADVTLVCYGHTGWTDTQQTGQISLHMSIDVRLTQPAPGRRPEDPDLDPDAQPGPERFPDGFEGDPAPGRAAGEPDAS